VDQSRLVLRRAFDRRQRDNERWSGIKLTGSFAPELRGDQWTATLRGIVHLGRIHEVTFLDAIEPLIATRLEALPRCLLRRDVYDYVHGAIWSTRGLHECSDSDLSFCFNAINRRGGFKPLTYRRGFQTP
jgi:hypothetical protein